MTTPARTFDQELIESLKRVHCFLAQEIESDTKQIKFLERRVRALKELLESATPPAQKEGSNANT